MSADHQPLARRLTAVWQRSDQLFALLADGALMQRPIALRHPFLFYLGHLPAFAWNQLGAGALGRPPVDPHFDSLFERGIDPLDEASAADASIQAERWPAVGAVLAYRDRVRAALLEALPEVAARSDSPLLERERVVEVVAEHEEMHHETLAYMVQRLDLRWLVAPPGSSPPPAPGGEATPERVRVPAGVARLGADWEEQRFGWDNEFPAVKQPVDAFGIDALPVTVARFRAFVQDGGYRRADLWSPDAWAWRERAGLEAPIDWRDTAEGWRCRWLLGELPLEEVGAWPVRVSHAEASAFARWSGARLPTEAELHRAAFGRPDGGINPHPWGEEPPSTERGNADWQRMHPVAVGSRPAGASAWGVHELVGNGWEWSDSIFDERPGFRAWMPDYPGYSADFFDGRHRVVFGGSWATATGLLRRSFRNWYQGHYPYVFAGFRLVAEP